MLHLWCDRVYGSHTSPKPPLNCLKLPRTVAALVLQAERRRGATALARQAAPWAALTPGPRPRRAGPGAPRCAPAAHAPRPRSPPGRAAPSATASAALRAAVFEVVHHRAPRQPGLGRPRRDPGPLLVCHRQLERVCPVASLVARPPRSRSPGYGVLPTLTPPYPAPASSCRRASPAMPARIAT